MKVSLLTTSKSVFIHFIRWFAAFLVLLGHINMLSEHNVPDNFLSYIGSQAHSGVIIFFVLSGFVIAFSVNNSKSVSCKKYFIDRISRIYSVLPLALILTILIDLIGSGFSDAYFDSSLIPQDNYLIRLLINMFSLQGWQGYRSQFGSNSPLWSIGYEVFYYAIFGLVYFWKDIFLKKIKLAIFCIFILFFLAGLKVSLYFLIWCLGYVAYQIQRSVKLPPIFFWVFLFSFIFINHYMKFVFFDCPEFFQDILIAFAFALLLIAPTPNIPMERLHKALADLSYSLYAFHMPFLFFGYFVIFNNKLTYFYYLIIMTLFCFFSAWCLSKIVERNRFFLRDFFNAKFH